MKAYCCKTGEEPGPEYFEDACYEIATELARLVISKQKDYGHENILAFGEFGILVRVNDKIARLKNLQDKEVSNEPTEDSWKDMAGYSILAIMLRRGTFELPLKDK